MFEDLKSLDALREQMNAKRGICPTARKCHTREELAYWFFLAGVAAGAIARGAEPVS